MATTASKLITHGDLARLREIASEAHELRKQQNVLIDEVARIIGDETEHQDDACELVCLFVDDEHVEQLADELVDRLGFKVLRGSQIQGNSQHDDGAYACCSFCNRYSDDPRALAHEIYCDCGIANGWSGSFAQPTDESRWSESSEIVTPK